MVFSSNTCACFEAAAAHTQQTDSDDIDLRWQTCKQRPVLLHIHSFSQRAFLLDRLQSILQMQQMVNVCSRCICRLYTFNRRMVAALHKAATSAAS